MLGPKERITKGSGFLGQEGLANAYLDMEQESDFKLYEAKRKVLSILKGYDVKRKDLRTLLGGVPKRDDYALFHDKQREFEWREIERIYK